MKPVRLPAATSIGLSLLLGLWLVAVLWPEDTDRAEVAPREQAQPEAQTEAFETPTADATPPSVVQLPPPPAASVMREVAAVMEPTLEPLKPTPQVKAKPDPLPEPLKPQPKKSAVKAEPVAAPKALVESMPAVIQPDTEAVQAGRTWLRILEHGEGPSIEIAWPTGPKGEALYRTMTACYGLTLAVIDGQGRLFTDSGARGEPWDLNLDRYSGFMRQTGSWHAAGERAALNAIRARHGTVRGTPVRLLHRQVDARMLGGFARMIGINHEKANTVRAAYALDAGRLVVTDIHVDGQLIQGRIDLTSAAACRQGRTL